MSRLESGGSFYLLGGIVLPKNKLTPPKFLRYLVTILKLLIVKKFINTLPFSSSK